jgi:hypothetical protein
MFGAFRSELQVDTGPRPELEKDLLLKCECLDMST